jgi:hypothetical protein
MKYQRGAPSRWRINFHLTSVATGHLPELRTMAPNPLKQFKKDLGAEADRVPGLTAMTRKKQIERANDDALHGQILRNGFYAD